MGALRNYRIAVLLSKNFGSLQVITAKKAGEQIVGKNMTVHQVKTFDYKNLSRLFTRPTEAQAPAQFKKKSTLWWWSSNYSTPFRSIFCSGKAGCCIC